MKFLVSQMSYFLRDPKAKRNLGALGSYLLILAVLVTVYSIGFHVLMLLEGQKHSWLTGLYWTLTVMSTLGFGDITFTSDAGRLFSTLVLVSGLILLIIMLPFAFIRFFYAPWLEAQIKAAVPKSVPGQTKDHLIICRRDWITNGLIRKLKVMGIPYCLLEDDAEQAVQLQEDGFNVINAPIDDPDTYRALNVENARLLLANAEDMVNTNIILTVRSIDQNLPIIALAEEEDSVDIFKLSGATYPLPLKVRLGEQLATRVSAGIGTAHEIGRFRDLVIVEFLVHDTPLAGVTLRDANLRERTGVNVVGVWKSGKLCPVQPDAVLEETFVPVAVGSASQINRLNRLLGTGEKKKHQVLVIGGGKVGQSTARALKRRGVHVRILDLNPKLEETLGEFCDEVIIGNGSDLATMKRAGIDSVSAVALTTHDDAQNIHLTVYCRRLRPEIGIVSRITRERNIEAIYRAGADFVISYASLGCEFITAYLSNREPVMVGEGADFFSLHVPEKLAGKTLLESGIGAATNLVVLAIEDGDQYNSNPGPDAVLHPQCKLFMLGTNEQRDQFVKLFCKS
ncbi:MAG: potassium channel family protein [Puniceicoccaceae bacterium]